MVNYGHEYATPSEKSFEVEDLIDGTSVAILSDGR